MMRHLHDVLAARRDDLLQRWERNGEGYSAVRTPAAARSLLAEIEEALRHAVEDDEASPPEAAGQDTNARGDSTKPGYTPAGLEDHVMVVVRAHGRLQRDILSLAAENAVDVSLAEQRAVAAVVGLAIEGAVARYLVEKDRELHRVGHDLRNPLGSALMALSLLRRRGNLGENEHLADTIERNLRRVQLLIDEKVARPSGVDAQSGRRSEEGA
jgi:hypothetical protein